MTRYEMMEEMRTKMHVARRDERLNAELSKRLLESEEESLARFYRDALAKNPLAMQQDNLFFA